MLLASLGAALLVWQNVKEAPDSPQKGLEDSLRPQGGAAAGGD